MKNIRRLSALSLLVACGSLAACSSDPAPDPDLAARLEADSGVKWTVYRDPDTQEVRFVAPAKPVQIAGATPEDKARGFFTRYGDAFGTKGNEIELSLARTDRRGGKHLRFVHKIAGTDVRALDVGTTAHFTDDGSVTWFEVAFRGDLDKVDAKPKLAQDEAIGKAIAHVKATCGAIKGDAKSDGVELGASVTQPGPSRLVYRVGVTVASERCGSPAVLVDAKDGSIVALEERQHAIDATAGGTRFELVGDAADVKTFSVTSVADASGPRYQMTSDAPARRRVLTKDARNGEVFETRRISQWDTSSSARGAAVDAHFHTERALVFLRSVGDAQIAEGHRFPGVPLDLDVNAFVHIVDPKTGGPVFNAFARVENGQDTIRFGDGDTNVDPDVLPLSASFDVTAHELTHLITAHTSALKYERESGALNESFSDVLGAAAEHWFAPDNSTDTVNLLIGETIFSKPARGWRPSQTCIVNDHKVFRDMIRPENCGSAGHVDSAFARTCAPGVVPSQENDQCFVHFNSGIPNRVFSLMVQGGFVENPMTQKRIGVPAPLGWERATELFYWSVTGLSANATFQNAAHAQIAESGRMGLDALKIANCAWYAVGVLQPSNVVDQWFVDNVCVAPAPPPPPPPSPPPDPLPGANDCAGHGDNAVCSSLFPGMATQCKGGNPVGQLYCADMTQRCKRKSPTDPTATVDVDTNALFCE